MGNPRSFTTNFNTMRHELDVFVRSRAGRSMTKRRAAMEKAATMPNSLPVSERVKARQEAGK